MKKEYIAPVVVVIKIGTVSMLATSGEGGLSVQVAPLMVQMAH